MPPILSVVYTQAGERDIPGLDVPREGAWLEEVEQAEPTPSEPNPNGPETWTRYLGPRDSKQFPIPDRIEPAGGLPVDDADESWPARWAVGINASCF